MTFQNRLLKTIVRIGLYYKSFMSTVILNVKIFKGYHLFAQPLCQWKTSQEWPTTVWKTWTKRTTMMTWKMTRIFWLVRLHTSLSLNYSPCIVNHKSEPASGVTSASRDYSHSRLKPGRVTGSGWWGGNGGGHEGGLHFHCHCRIFSSEHTRVPDSAGGCCSWQSRASHTLKRDLQSDAVWYTKRSLKTFFSYLPCVLNQLSRNGCEQLDYF